MSNDNRKNESKSGKSGKGSDSEAGLQKELEKESAEGQSSVGDVKSNRNLSGASTWDTLPDQQADADSNAGKSKNSGKKSG